MGHENYYRTEITEYSSNRSFGLVFSLVFIIFAVAPLVRGASLRYWCGAVSGTILLISVFKPQLLAMPNKCWFMLGKLLHIVVNPIVLSVMFFLILTPYAVVLRIFRKDPLGLAREPNADSYWRKRGATGRNMKHQF
jgi:hypothetical protein